MALPYYLHRESILQHVMVHGATGSGKTSMVLMPMLQQLIKMSAFHADSSVVILDQKGDSAFFELMRRTATQWGLPFKWFTTKLRHSTFGMNPFLQSHFHTDLTRNQAAEMFAKAFGLDHGNEYGASYFRDMAVLVLRALLELPEVDSFAKLSRYAQKHPDFFELPKKTAEQTTHLRATLDALATIEPLNVSPETHPKPIVDHQIDVADVLSTPQVLYFYLPSTLEDLVCFTVAKLVGYLLLTAAAMRPADERNNVYLCIDEFQRIVSQDFTVFVQQARSLGIGCILASQTTADLRAAGTDFQEILAENTNTVIDLTSIGLQQQMRMQRQSPLGRLTVTGGTLSLTDSLTREDLTRLTARTGQGTVRVAMPYGLTQCGGHQVQFRTKHYMPKSEYDSLMAAQWPEVEDHPGTILVTGTPPGSGSGGASPKQPAPDQRSPLQRAASRILRDQTEDNA